MLQRVKKKHAKGTAVGQPYPAGELHALLLTLLEMQTLVNSVSVKTKSGTGVRGLDNRQKVKNVTLSDEDHHGSGYAVVGSWNVPWPCHALPLFAELIKEHTVGTPWPSRNQCETTELALFICTQKPKTLQDFPSHRIL